MISKEEIFHEVQQRCDFARFYDTKNAWLVEWVEKNLTKDEVRILIASCWTVSGAWKRLLAYAQEQLEWNDSVLHCTTLFAHKVKSCLACQRAKAVSEAIPKVPKVSEGQLKFVWGDDDVVFAPATFFKSLKELKASKQNGTK